MTAQHNTVPGPFLHTFLSSFLTIIPSDQQQKHESEQKYTRIIAKLIVEEKLSKQPTSYLKGRNTLWMYPKVTPVSSSNLWPQRIHILPKEPGCVHASFSVDSSAQTNNVLLISAHKSSKYIFLSFKNTTRNNNKQLEGISKV